MLAASVLLCALVAQPAESSTAVARDRPNILLIITDDQAWSHFTRPLMPRVFSDIVDRGALFTRAYASSSVCCPSRAEMFTGLYEHNTNVDSNLRAAPAPDHRHGAPRRRLPHDDGGQIPEQLDDVRATSGVRPVVVSLHARSLHVLTGGPVDQRRRNVHALHGLPDGHPGVAGHLVHPGDPRRPAVLRDLRAHLAALPRGRSQVRRDAGDGAEAAELEHEHLDRGLADVHPALPDERGTHRIHRPPLPEGRLLRAGHGRRHRIVAGRARRPGRRHVGGVHLRQRLPVRRASPRGQVRRVRGGRPHPHGRALPGRAGAGGRLPHLEPGREHRRRADAGRRRRAALGGGRRLDPAARQRRSRSRPRRRPAGALPRRSDGLGPVHRAPLRGRDGLSAHLRRRRDRAVQVPRVRERRSAALRPRRRSLRAGEPRRRPRIGPDPHAAVGEAGGTTGPSAGRHHDRDGSDRNDAPAGRRVHVLLGVAVRDPSLPAGPRRSGGPVARLLGRERRRREPRRRRVRVRGRRHGRDGGHRSHPGLPCLPGGDVERTGRHDRGRDRRPCSAPAAQRSDS